MLSRSIRRTIQISKFSRYSSTVALRNSLERIDRHNGEINAFISVSDRIVLEEKAKESDERQLKGATLSPIDGTVIAVKDNICTRSLPTTCASNMLKDFSSPYDATVVELLQKAGALIVGKTNMDEFGMGSLNVHSAFGPVVNPLSTKDKRLSAGGSSGGSAASVAMGMCTAALGSDTGGSIRMPASYCGLVGFKPSYGRCSRRGLIAYANSLDTIGILSRNVKDCSDVYDIISKYDIQDPTCIPIDLRNELEKNEKDLLSNFQQSGDLKGLTVGIPQEFYVDSLSDEVIEIWRKGIQHLQKRGANIMPVSIPHISLSLPAYYTIAFAEASSNLARYDGIRYGHRSLDNVDHLLYEDTRTTGFGDEVQRRILLGTHVLTAGTYEALFLPAQKIRRLIQKEFNQVFKQPNLLCTEDQSSQDSVDVLLVPSATSPAPDLSHPSAIEYLDDVMTLPANLAGLPAITVPFGNQAQRPIGLQLLVQYGYDRFVIRIAEEMTMNE
ncbi:MAG: amidase signature domain-containing protein [Benjaminiella poitrasii]|nr:MAG: amidase signature domain-containing protein [Benjaminiella poitrasii]